MNKSVMGAVASDAKHIAWLVLLDDPAINLRDIFTADQLRTVEIIHGCGYEQGQTAALRSVSELWMPEGER